MPASKHKTVEKYQNEDQVAVSSIKFWDCISQVDPKFITPCHDA